MEEIKFHSKAPMLKYRQNSMHSCCFSSLESDFDCTNQKKAANVIAMLIKESLTSQVGNHIDFANDIWKNLKRV